MTTLELTGIIHDLAETEYHAHPALSSTGARLILDSPARFHYAQSHPQAHKDAFDLGTAAHAKVLGVGARIILCPDEHLTPSGALSTKAATVAWLDEQRAEGLIVIGRKQASAVDAMAEAVLAHPTAKALFEQDGVAEASVFATDPETNVDMRARFDFLPNLDNTNPVAVDLKTTAKAASKLEFERSVVSFSYDVQQVHYQQTLALATRQEVPMVFVVVETEPPHLVAVHQIDIIWTQMGATKARRARELFAHCTASNEWPGYPIDVQLISPPTWLVYQHEETYT